MTLCWEVCVLITRAANQHMNAGNYEVTLCYYVYIMNKRNCIQPFNIHIFKIFLLCTFFTKICTHLNNPHKLQQA
jgi:hypothetical protein